MQKKFIGYMSLHNWKIEGGMETRRMHWLDTQAELEVLA